MNKKPEKSEIKSNSTRCKNNSKNAKQISI